MFNNWRASQVVLVGLIIIIVISGGAWRTEESSAGSVRQSAGAATRNPLCKCPGWDSWRRSIAVLSHSPCSFIYPSCHLSIYPSLHHGVILCCHHPSRRFHYGPSFIPHPTSLLMFHHVSSIDCDVPSCSIHWSWCSIMSQVIDCNVPSCSIDCDVPADRGELCGEFGLAPSQRLWVFATGVGGGQAGGEEDWWLYL